jgi:hypothetical protein
MSESWLIHHSHGGTGRSLNRVRGGGDVSLLFAEAAVEFVILAASGIAFGKAKIQPGFLDVWHGCGSFHGDGIGPFDTV